MFHTPFGDFDQDSSVSSVTNDGPDTASLHIPDADLIFNGHYHRAGSDLTLTGADGHKLVIVDYFRFEKHPDLIAPNGGVLSGDVVDLLAGPSAPGQYAQAAAPVPGAQVIGKVDKIVGSATVQHANGTVSELHVGDAIYVGDVVQTGADSTLGVSFTDGTALSFAANTRMALNEFNYDPNSATANSGVLNLVEGTFAFIAGQVAHTGGLNINTPAATMGIRGTSGGAACSNIGACQFFASTNPDGTLSVYALVRSGSTVAQVSVGTLAIVSPTGQITFTPVSNLDPNINNLIETLKQDYLQQNITTPPPNAPNDRPNSSGNLGSGGLLPQTAALTDGLIQLQSYSFLLNFLDNGFNPKNNPIFDIPQNQPLPQSTAPTVQSPIGTHVSAEDASFTFSVPDGTFSDPDNQPLSLSATLADGSPLPSWLHFDPSTHTFSAPNGPPTNFNGELAVKVTASDGTGSVSDTFTLTITPVNNAPTVTAPTATLNTILEDANPAGQTVAQVLSANFSDAADEVAGGSHANAFAGIAITGDAATSAQGVWQYFSGGSWHDVTGVSESHALILSADTLIRFLPAPNFNGQAPALTVHLIDNSDGPVTTGDTVDFTGATGGSTPVSADTVNVSESITPVNDAPVVDTHGGSLAYVEGQSAAAVDAAVTVSDVDSATLAGATVRISGNFHAGEDFLTFTDQNGITGSYDPATGILTLSGSASVADYQAALASVGYHNSSDNPSGDTRTVSYQVDDGSSENHASDVATATVSVAPVNNAPAVDTNGGSLAYTEGQAATAVDTAVTVSDVDSTTLAGATVRISGSFHAGQDFLTFTNQNGITGSYNAATGILTLTGIATLAQYQDALASVGYFNSSENPSGDTRTISYQVDDGSAQNHASNVATATVSVTPVNDAPVVDTHGGSLAYTEGQAPAAIDTAVTVSDVDSTTLAGATVRISGNFHAGQDFLTFINQNGISGSYNPSTGVLTLTGTATVAQYQAALASVGYVNSSQDPSGDTRTISYLVNDGSAQNHDSNVATATVSVTPVNTPPHVDTHGGSLAYTEDQAPTAIDPVILVSDPDSTTLSGATVRISGNFHADQDVLAFTNQNGITGSYNALTGVLTLAGIASLADYQAALASVTYFNSSEDPSGATRTISFQVDDGSSVNHASNVAATTVAVTPVDDAPFILAPNSLQYDPSFGDDTAFNRVAFADADSSGLFTVHITRTGGDGSLYASSGGGVIVGGNSGDLTLTGSLDAINAFLAGSHVGLDTHGNTTDTFSISIFDGEATTTKTNFVVSDVSFISTHGADVNNFAGVDVYQSVLSADTGSDTVYTSWSHLGDSPTLYTDNSANIGTDTIYLIFTASQLQEIFSSAATRNDLQTFLFNADGNGLDLGDTSWHANVANGLFENAHIELANVFSTRDVADPADNYIDIDSMWHAVIAPSSSSNNEIVGLNGTGGNDFIIANAPGTVSGQGGNDVLVAANAGNTLDGGSGNDFLLGGPGNDTLIGGTGNDVLAGAGGSDTFVFSGAGFGHDIIADFDLAHDTVSLTVDHTLTSSVTDLLANHTADVNGNAVITLGSDTITFVGITAQMLQTFSHDFHLTTT